MRSLLLVLALGGSAAAQGEIKPFPKVDPYTKGDPGATEKAGYVSFGPFRFGDDHTTSQIETTLGGIPLIWVETAHFKLGSALPEYALRDDASEIKKLKLELERLAARLPDVKVKVKKLDPWLRLHLFAQRLEDLYARFLTQLRLSESDFDPRASRVDMGPGRYLGMPAKFTVLLFDKKSSVGRYSGVYLGQPLDSPTRWVFPTVGSFLFLSAFEFLEGEYQNDTGLHCDVVSGVAQNLGAGFRGYRVVLPLAVSEGLAHWFSREIDPRYHIFSGLDSTKVRTKDDSNWGPSVRARVEHKVFVSTADMLAWKDPEALEWADHLILWSRMDYLMAREDGAAGTLLRLLKEPPGSTQPLSDEEVLERARQAYQTVAGGELAKFDADWGEWVLKTYPKK